MEKLSIRGYVGNYVKLGIKLVLRKAKRGRFWGRKFGRKGWFDDASHDPLNSAVGLTLFSGYTAPPGLTESKP